MGSSFQSSLRSESLERTNILTNILSEVDFYSDKFDLIDFTALKTEVLEPLLADTFDPETQIRGFLKTLRHTLAYEEAFSQIESQQLRDQIDGFIDGLCAKDVVGAEAFDIVSHPSPPVQHHFSLISELKRWVHGLFGVVGTLHEAVHPHHGQHVKDLPTVFENVNETKVVEVSTQYSLH